MTRRAEGDWGRCPETPGHQRLVKFVAKHSISKLAELVDVKPAVAHAWFWRDSRPSDEMIGRLLTVIGGTREEWLTPDQKAQQRETKKKLRELQKGAA